MSTCAHGISEETVEALALGIELDDGDAPSLRAHVEQCALCATAHARIAKELALFEERAELLAHLEPAPSFLALDIASPSEVVPPWERRSVSHAFGALEGRSFAFAAGALACAAALLLLVAAARRDRDPSACSSTASPNLEAASENASDDVSLAPLSPSRTCEAPIRAYATNAVLASLATHAHASRGDTLSCEGETIPTPFNLGTRANRASERIICEELVTSSFATP